ncbi:hypothetical protein [Bradyrhizobium sp.]|uniref:hypothetical protein n=1 Tax=Bradyrhizobium sp. TaxID=376 RepID=UPI002735CC64|nr:hypothetical protein [Bradyrhizobium sp.]MDP3078469.1 hypothetical protein [Bradyrhizobium sp.]
MTLVAVWMAETRLMAIADSRIVRSAGNVLTEHGPKLLPITVICMQPSQNGAFDRVVYRSDIGFAYSGATLSALAAHALSTTLLSKLIGMPGAPPPALNELAHFVAGASAEYMREVGQLALKNGLFSALVFGWCPREQRLRIFELQPRITDGQLTVDNMERNLSPIKIGGIAKECAVTIGGGADDFAEEIDKELANAKNRGEVLEIVAFDAPKRALRRMIAEGSNQMIGGVIQQAWATSSGFQILSNLEPITPRPPSPRNVGSFILGFDTMDIQTVGSYQVGGLGR